jgi:hypothetical protein
MDQMERRPTSQSLVDPDGNQIIIAQDKDS